MTDLVSESVFGGFWHKNLYRIYSLLFKLNEVDHFTIFYGFLSFLCNGGKVINKEERRKKGERGRVKERGLEIIP